MKRYVDHDSVVEKNRSIARSQDIDNKDRAMAKKGFDYFQRQQEASCFNCKAKQKCSEFRTKKTGGTAGVVSFGGDEKFICDRYAPVGPENRTMSDKQIKSLLKNAKRAFR
jgi:hypothetical protein